MTKTSKLAYLAGLIDGDGSLGITIIKRKDGNWEGHSFQPNISLGMTSRKQCKWVQHHFGGNLYGYDQGVNQKVFHLRINGKRSVQEILTGILPFLLIKKQTALTILKYLSLGDTVCPDERMVLARQAQEDNKQNHLTECERNMNSRESAAYLAGIVDSEGCIGIRSVDGGFSAYIKINSVNEALIRWMASIYDGKVRQHKYKKTSCRDCHLWDLYGKKNIEKVLLSVIPYLVLKKELANTVLQFVRLPNTWNKDERQRLHDLSKTMTVRRGTQTTNTANCPENGQMIESDLHGDMQCEPVVMLAS